MSMNVIYVEDDEKDRQKLVDAIETSNEKWGGPPIRVGLVPDHRKLREHLSMDCDLVLADVWFWNPKTKKPDVFGLDEIIQCVEDWSKENSIERSIPIIAYTGWGEESLEMCLERRTHLFDIWDKLSASPPYVAWRLSQLARDLSFYRPDAALQRMIRTMSNGARWHDDVVRMTMRYDAGWSEEDQVERAGNSIQDIAHSLDQHVWEQLAPLWRVVGQWEQISRSTSRSLWGDARHAIHVFWLGYYILHHALLRGYFEQTWKDLLLRRANMNAVATQIALEAVSDTWFYTGLFHDAALCFESYSSLRESLLKMFAHFGINLAADCDREVRHPTYFQVQVEKVFSEFEEPAAQIVKKGWVQSFEKGAPDHGIVAAAYLRSIVADARQQCFVKEASRAISLHHVVGNTDVKAIQGLQWDAEPIGCLLILCDQIQSWDRDRRDVTIADRDWPSKSELTAIDVAQETDKPEIRLTVNYFSPRHLERAHTARERLREELTNVLRDKPDRVVHRISKPWPFRLWVRFCLDNILLKADLRI